MFASLLRTLSIVIPIGILAWLYVIWRFPAQYLVHLSLMVGGIMLVVGIAIYWLSEQHRHYLNGIANWAEGISGSGTSTVPLPATESAGVRIVGAVQRSIRKQQRQSKKRARDLDRLLTILDYMNDGVVILNKSGRVRIVNPAACALLGTDVEEAKGRTFVQFVRDHRITELWRQSEDTKLQVKGTVELADVLLRVVATPFLHGNARGFLIILQDLTELNHLQTVRQNFVTNVSHELRTPLASIRALAETLAEGALEDPPAARRFLNRMEIEVDALTALVTDLFDLSRIESGHIGLEYVEVKPLDLINESVERLSTQVDRAQIDLAVKVPDKLPLVTIDRDRIEQVMVNLLHNAIKFTQPNGEVNVLAEQNNGSITVSVKDTGVGIPDEDLPHIFERFYKVDRARRGGGSGLGLAIAKHIVQAHDGTIWAESVEGEGSTFSFSLPVGNRE